jgi:hypothetical protein
VGARLIAACGTAVLLTACTTTVRGTASPPPTTEATPTSETSAPAPTTPAIEVTPPPERGPGTVLEAHRIASVTALVPENFPERTEGCFPYGPWLTPESLESLYFSAGTAAPVLERWGFVAGWGQCNQEPDAGLGTLTLVMELSDPESAEQAALELSEAQQTQGYEPTPVRGLPVDVLVLDDGDQELIQVFLPVGRMVAYAFHHADPGQGRGEIARLIEDQMALLESFEPTPQSDVPDLPADPAGLARYALTLPGEATPFSGPYDLEGYLRLAIDPIREREVLTANGFSGFYSNQSNEGDRSYAVALYTFPAAAQTNAVYEAFAELETAAYGGTKFVLPAIPAAPCFVFSSGETFFQRCYVGHGSYLASVDVGGLAAADDVATMNQLLPAQRDLIDG